MTVSRDDLFRLRLDTTQVEVAGLGVFKIRALSREEVLGFRKVKTDEGLSLGDDAAAMECHMVAAALVDPELTVEDVARWQRVSPVGELEVLTDAIAQVSGMNTGAVKEAVKRFPQ